MFWPVPPPPSLPHTHTHPWRLMFPTVTFYGSNSKTPVIVRPACVCEARRPRAPAVGWIGGSSFPASVPPSHLICAPVRLLTSRPSRPRRVLQAPHPPTPSPMYNPCAIQGGGGGQHVGCIS